MKNYSGKQKIGEYFDIDLYVDFDDLFRYQGERNLAVGASKIVGRIVMLLGFALLLIPLVLLFLQGKAPLAHLMHPDSVTMLVPFFSIYVILYAFYLLRDRNEFGFNTEILNYKKVKQLVELGEVKELEVDNYFSEEVLGELDKAFFTDDKKFLEVLSKFLFEDKTNISLLEKRLSIDSKIFMDKLANFHKSADTSFDTNHMMFFLRCFSTAVEMDVAFIDVQVLFLIMCKYYWKEVILDMEASEMEIEGLMAWLENERRREYYYKKWKYLSKLKPQGAINRAYTSRATPMLDTYGEDFTAQAADKRFVTAIGKDEVLLELFRSLQKEHGSAALILGDPGVGKTYFLRYLATRMVIEDVPELLRDKRLVIVDLSKVMAKAASIDNFKSVLQKMLQEVIVSGNIILCFEEIGNIFGLRDEGREEVVSLLSSMINDHNIQVIGTATRQDYMRKMRVTKGFVALFETFELPVPKPHLAFQIVMDYIPEMEKKYGISIRSSAVKRIVDFGDSLMHDRVMPDKGIVLLEEAIIRAEAQRLSFIDENLIDEILKEQIGINVGNISDNESQLLTNLEEELHKRVIGQKDAIQGVAAALRRARAGMVSGKRPLASFLFYGPTGVGKTEVARTLTATYYGDEKLMTRIDMSEYQEEENLNRLIGYSDENGNLLGGHLSEAVRMKPYSLVLLDELEKANPKVLDLFLQVLDEGNLTDGLGRTVDFTHTIIIATSNAGSKQIAELILKGKSYQEVQRDVQPILREVYRVEFLNRFDKVIMFKPLSQAEIEQIADILLHKVNSTLEDKGMSMKWNEKTLHILAEMGYNSIYGARELRRVIQDTIENKLAELIISKQAVSGCEIIFSGMEVVSINR